jgi:hypothetical protein
MALRFVPFLAVGAMGVILGAGASVGISHALSANAPQSYYVEATFPDIPGSAPHQSIAGSPRAQKVGPLANVTPSEAAGARQTEHLKRIQAVEAEAIDSAWAARTEESIRSGLTEISKRVTFESKKVACKTTSCVAVLRWPSYELARNTYTDFLHSTFAGECGRAILLPSVDKEAPGAAVEATMVLNCNRDHSGKAAGVKDAP